MMVAPFRAQCCTWCGRAPIASPTSRPISRKEAAAALGEIAAPATSVPDRLADQAVSQMTSLATITSRPIAREPRSAARRTFSCTPRPVLDGSDIV